MQTIPVPFPTEAQLASHRPIPFYFISTTDPDDLSYNGAYQALFRLKEEGFGGIILFNKPQGGFTPEDYLGEKWFSMVKNFLRAAKKLSLVVWIHDGFNCPTGSAGGRINRNTHPHLTQRRLRLNGDTVSVEEVEWGFPAFEEPESAELFHRYVHEAYLREVGEYFGNTIPGFFSDADCRRIDDDVHQEGNPKRDYFPWSSTFAETFQAAYGYDITPYLPSVLRRENSPQAVDYWEHSSTLYQTWFASNYRWCKEHGLLYTYHTSDGSPFALYQTPRSSLYSEGRAITVESHSDFPGVDHECLNLNGGTLMAHRFHFRNSWGSYFPIARNPDFYNVYGATRAKMAASSSFLYHRKGAFCEMFAATTWGVSISELLQIAAWQIMQGITFVTPHAYHHRLHGYLKYFAPPDFSPHSHLTHGLRQMNDTIATYIHFTTQGTLQAPIALLDITDDLWEGYEDNQTYFAVCQKLNRLPYGFVIADPQMLVKNRNAFSVIINAGAPLHGKRLAILEATGLPILGAGELDRLGAYIPCAVSYEGQGHPHFMRRKLDDGQELIAIANIEDGRPISGSLTVDGCTYPADLVPGQIAFYTRDGQILLEQKPLPGETVLTLPEEVPVTWNKENLIPLEWWLDDTGRCAVKGGNEQTLHFPFTVADNGATGLQLYIPVDTAARVTQVLLDGQAIPHGIPDKVFEEPYLRYPLPAAAVPGSHTLTLQKTGSFAGWDRILLQGQFNVDVQVENPYFKRASMYGTGLRVPEKATVTLSARSQTLHTAKCWCEQGQTFYSGGAIYRVALDLPDNDAPLMLALDAVRDVCGVSIDGGPVQMCIRTPFHIPLGRLTGKHTMDIHVFNSNANAMEAHPQLSGLLAGGRICKVQSFQEQKKDV